MGGIQYLIDYVCLVCWIALTENVLIHCRQPVYILFKNNLKCTFIIVLVPKFIPLKVKGFERSFKTVIKTKAYHPSKIFHGDLEVTDEGFNTVFLAFEPFN